MLGGADNRGTEGAKIETPKASRGKGMGCPPPQLTSQTRGLGEGPCCTTKKAVHFFHSFGGLGPPGPPLATTMVNS